MGIWADGKFERSSDFRKRQKQAEKRGSRFRKFLFIASLAAAAAVGYVYLPDALSSALDSLRDLLPCPPPRRTGPKPCAPTRTGC